MGNTTPVKFVGRAVRNKASKSSLSVERVNIADLLGLPSDTSNDDAGAPMHKARRAGRGFKLFLRSQESTGLIDRSMLVDRSMEEEFLNSMDQDDLTLPVTMNFLFHSGN